jgi:hypothetical protein
MAKDMNESVSNTKIKTASKTSKKGTAKKADVETTAPKAAAKPAVVVPAAVIAPAPKAAAAPKAPSPKAAAKVTSIVAKVDVGFGNSLFIRGTGPGLSWEKGVEMTNTGSDEWFWSTNKASDSFLAKVLINDIIWSGDPDTTVVAGTKTVITASF